MVCSNHLFPTAVFICLSIQSPGQSSWTQVADYGGGPCSFTTSTVINGLAYIPCSNELWEYNPATDSWNQKSDFPGSARVGAVSFEIENLFYFGTGNILFGAVLNDWWRYDPSNDSWLQLNYFPGTLRYAAVGFSIGSMGYIATGFASGPVYKNDLWEYNPASDQWTQKTDMPDVGRYLAAGFSVADKGYVITGYESVAGDVKDVWEYNPVSNAWLQKGNFSGLARREAAGFSSSQKGYIITGGTSSAQLTDAWEYNPAADSWTALPNLPAGGRQAAAGFAVNDTPYVGIGFVPAGVTYQDFWKLVPPTILPIELTSFSGTVVDKGNLIEWSTASELNNDFFTIERSSNEGPFDEIKIIDANGTTFSSSHYIFLDTLFYPGTNYYRLKQTDFDGTYTYSKTIAVERSSSLMTIQYSPDDHSAFLEINSLYDEKIIVSLRDVRGGLLKEESATVAAGFNRIKIDLPASLKGICFLDIGLPAQKRFVGKIAVW